MVVELSYGDDGKVRQLAKPIKFSETKLNYGKAGTKAGIHTGKKDKDRGNGRSRSYSSVSRLAWKCKSR